MKKESKKESKKDGSKWSGKENSGENVGNGIHQEDAWTFRVEGLADEFDQHVNLSVPGYDQVQGLVGQLSRYFLYDGCSVVDYGCSTGRTLQEIAARNKGRKIEYIGVDDSHEMCEKARERMSSLGVSFDILNAQAEKTFPPSNVALVIMIYTAQFMPEKSRWKFFLDMTSKMPPGSGLIVVEKTIPDEPRFSQIFSEIHIEQKKKHFDSMEVDSKARSLIGVLRPEQTNSFEQRLKQYGFSVSKFWQTLAFSGWVCRRS